MQLWIPIKGEDKRQKGKRFASLQVQPEQGKYKSTGEAEQRGISKKKRKKKTKGENSTGLEQLQTTNGRTPELPVRKRRGARSEVVPHGFHVGKYSCLRTLLMLQFPHWSTFISAFAQTVFTVETFTLALIVSVCAAGNWGGLWTAMCSRLAQKKNAAECERGVTLNSLFSI